jgi:streptomycin 6-kinase
VLKISWPHREAAGEAAALRAWNGHAAVRLLEHDEDRFALLIERCVPGGPLSGADHLSAHQRLEIGAGMLRELWSAPAEATAGVERLTDVAAEWAALVDERMERLRPLLDRGLVRHGARLLRDLPASASRDVLLHGDFNPGNVLAAQRLPWLVIDAKPMIGDPGYDPWPLVEQIDDPFSRPEPLPVLAERLALVAGILEQPVERLAGWGVARQVESALWLVSLDRPEDAASVMAQAGVLADLAGL